MTTTPSLENSENLPATPKASTISKRHAFQFRNKTNFYKFSPQTSPNYAAQFTFYAKNTVLSHLRLRRSIGDLFTPYSLTSVGDTANTNYKLMNNNFDKVHITESKLAHAQSVLFETFSTLEANEIDLLKKEIFLELRALKETSLNSFIFDLKQIYSFWAVKCNCLRINWFIPKYLIDDNVWSYEALLSIKLPLQLISSGRFLLLFEQSE